jgi:hypothetical protein
MQFSLTVGLIVFGKVAALYLYVVSNYLQISGAAIY